MVEIIVAGIAGLVGILCAVIEVRAGKDRKKADDERLRSEDRAARRAEESRLSMELMSASCKLGVVTAKALTNQHVNGDVEDAMEAAKKAQEEYDRFIHTLAGQQAAKV